ncbi:MAG TPA: glycosyltransferase [Sedimentisphaerales bacterium]|nr:glycosyltransferase [Sedimentisphaerales bacterium]
MIFLTVGTQFPFDRLVRAVDDLAGTGAIGEEIFAQVGDSAYKPRHFEAVTALDKNAFDMQLVKASAVISHAGMGTIAMAMDHGKAMLAMPRRRRYGEVVNDHQEGLANKFAACGHILVARDETELPGRIGQLKAFVPQIRRPSPDAVIRRISLFLEGLNREEARA